MENTLILHTIGLLHHCDRWGNLGAEYLDQRDDRERHCKRTVREVEVVFENIQKHLKPSARDDDIKNFNLLRWGDISIEECRDRFVKSNRIPVEIPTNIFEEWLKSEGWLKEEECLEEFQER